MSIISYFKKMTTTSNEFERVQQKESYIHNELNELSLTNL